MSFGRTRSVVVHGIEGTVIDVEAHVAQGLPKVVISGMPDSAVSQAPNRLRAAMGQSELEFPDSRLTLNLSPASLPKHGAALDLGMAVAILAAMRVVDTAEVGAVVHLGELGMDGTVRRVPGVLPAVMAGVDAGVSEFIVPVANADEAALVEGAQVRPVRTLSDVVAFHRARARNLPFVLPMPELQEPVEEQVLPDMRDVVGQHEAREALEIAAAGGHHLSMVGPPGAGKTVLASRLPSILPRLARADALAVTSVQSVLGLTGRAPLVERPPFIAPHHSATTAALVGGGSGRPKPGAVSQAHAGVLFLDEAPEFKRSVLDSLRQPLELGYVTVDRASGSVRYPSRFQLVLAWNPCPCGRFTGTGAGCTCSAKARIDYAKRLSGPLLDRIDVHLTVHAVTRADLVAGPGEPSERVAARVRQARERAECRWADLGVRTNAEVPGAVLRSSPWALSPSTTRPLDVALDRGALTLRGYDRALRLAWTMGDLRGEVRPTQDEVLAALTLRETEVAA